MLEKFGEQIERRHEYAREWKARTGGKVVGCICTYVPEEMLYAAGILPVRVLGSHEPQDVSDSHIYSMFCPFCRDCLAQGLLGRYDYLDGLVTGHSCLHIRQTYFSWKLNRPLPFTYYLGMPSKPQSPRAKPFLMGELEDFQAALESWVGRPITPADLDRGIEVLNENRRRLRELYELRKADDPPVSGAEAMEAVLSSQLMDKAEHSQLLKEALAELGGREGDRPAQDRVRLMLIGSEDDDTETIRLAESLGAAVVVDDHCTGTRSFWNPVVPAEDRLAAIASRYLDRPRCPQKDFEERSRLPHILQLAHDWRVQGAIVVQQKFCDPHELDIPVIMDLLKRELGIPSLFLEVDITLPAGQFRTRIEAFIEMLELEFV